MEHKIQLIIIDHEEKRREAKSAAFIYDFRIRIILPESVRISQARGCLFGIGLVEIET